MKEMFRQQLDAKAYFSNILQQIKQPTKDNFALARYQLMQKTIANALKDMYPETLSSTEAK